VYGAVTAEARKVTLDRSGGKKLGVRLGNAAGPGEPILIINVAPGTQAAGKLVAGDAVVAINGNSVLGMTMSEAAKFVMASEKVELTLGEKKVVLDRSGGKKLGCRIGGANGPGQPMQVIGIAPDGQANGKLAAGDTIFAINGHSVLGMSMKEAMKFVTSSDRCELTVGDGNHFANAGLEAALAKGLRAVFERADEGTSSLKSTLDATELAFRLDLGKTQALLEHAGLMPFFDTDKDGTFELEEVLQTMDANGDGNVSLEEFISAVVSAKERQKAR